MKYQPLSTLLGPTIVNPHSAGGFSLEPSGGLLAPCLSLVRKTRWVVFNCAPNQSELPFGFGSKPATPKSQQPLVSSKFAKEMMGIDGVFIRSGERSVTQCDLRHEANCVPIQRSQEISQSGCGSIPCTSLGCSPAFTYPFFGEGD